VFAGGRVRHADCSLRGQPPMNSSAFDRVAKIVIPRLVQLHFTTAPSILAVARGPSVSPSNVTLCMLPWLNRREEHPRSKLYCESGSLRNRGPTVRKRVPVLSHVAVSEACRSGVDSTGLWNVVTRGLEELHTKVFETIGEPDNSPGRIFTKFAI
jgi:hypothetical protein